MPSSKFDRAVSPVVATVLFVGLVAVIGASIGVATLDVSSETDEPEQIRFFDEAEVVLGPEYRSWSGGGGDEDRGDIDQITLRYEHGPTFEGREIGSVVVEWEGDDGNGGKLEYLNPNKFSAQTEQKYHPGEVGEFCTGSFRAGEALTIRMVHNRGQSGGETDPSEVGGEQYVESYWNDIERTGGSPFFRTNNRYPTEFSGERPMQAGDEVTITFYGPDRTAAVARQTATATLYGGTATEVGNDELDCS